MKYIASPTTSGEQQVVLSINIGCNEIMIVEKCFFTANELPNPLSRTPTVQTDGTFMLIGGFMGLAGATSDILTYNPLTENFDLHPESLPNPLYYHSAMLVDATLFEQC